MKHVDEGDDDELRATMKRVHEKEFADAHWWVLGYGLQELWRRQVDAEMTCAGCGHRIEQHKDIIGCLHIVAPAVRTAADLRPPRLGVSASYCQCAGFKPKRPSAYLLCHEAKILTTWIERAKTSLFHRLDLQRRLQAFKKLEDAVPNGHLYGGGVIRSGWAYLKEVKEKGDPSWRGKTSS